MLARATIEEVYRKLDDIDFKRSMNVKINQLPEIENVTILLDMVCVYDDIQLVYSAKIEDFKRAYPRSQLTCI